MEIMYFNKFLFRCPVFPFIFPEGESIKKIIKEAIYIASPDLYWAIQRTQGVPAHKANQNQVILAEISEQKYITRMSTRSTPFGLFAGCGIGEISDESSSILLEANSFVSKTRFDMDYITKLVYHITKEHKTQVRLQYLPNSSLYKTRNSYRYIEYKYEKEGKKYQIAEIEGNPIIDFILSICKSGLTKDRINELLRKEFTETKKENINEFITSLIENQVLVSAIEPTLTSGDYLQNILIELRNAGVQNEYTEMLYQLKKDISLIDKRNIGRDIELYSNIEKKLKRCNYQYDNKHIFQSDILINPVSANINKQIAETIKEAVIALTKLSPKIENLDISIFKDSFFKKYENQEIPLLEALDPDTGVGYSYHRPGEVDNSDFIDNIFKKENEYPNYTWNLTPFDLLLYKKYQQSLLLNEKEIVFTEEDIQELNHKETLVPLTFSCLAEVIDTGKNNDPTILIRSIGGYSAANLLSRFCHLDSSIHKFTAEITKKEEKLIDKSAIIAEILHLPENKTGNILLRPRLRNYEIPFLARETVKKEKVIPISDIFVSVPNGKKVILKSNRLNKEIIPRLTSAHNFSYKSLPLYNFLCSLQKQDHIPFYNFRWSHFLKDKIFLPRVTFKKTILQPATWNFTPKDLITNKDKSLDIPKFVSKYSLPSLVFLVEGDNKLFIDFNNQSSIKIFAKEIHNRNFILEEFLHTMHNGLINSGALTHHNEIIVSFYKSI